MATGKLEPIGYIFIWTTSYLTISIKIAYFPLGLPENFLKKSFRKPPSESSNGILGHRTVMLTLPPSFVWIAGVLGLVEL